MYSAPLTFQNSLSLTKKKTWKIDEIENVMY